ncbi:MAG: cell division protein ZapA [Clostridia bacterium]|nr:cell division protein ZapA [Clostridia bacterium]
MKQKYTITVADMELNIISDASPDEVENIVGILDRRMRDINLKSPRCTKNEAAVLCALSYCSERIAMQEAFKKVEKDAFRFAGENEKLKKTIESMQEELDNLRKDAAVMRSILDRAALTATPQPAAQEKPKYIPKPFAKKEEEEPAAPQQLSAFDNVPEQPTAPVPPAVPAQEPAVAASTPAKEEAPAANNTVKKAQKPANKNRVGSMFDLLTFSDV